MQGNLFAQVKNTYQSPAPQTQQNQPKVVFAARTREVKDQCDGITGPQVTSACLETAQTFEFDTDAPGGKTFGNLVHTLFEGDVTDLSDQRHERTEFVVDAVAWIHRPKHTRLLDSTGTVVLREKFLCYDNLNSPSQCGQLAGKGLLTKEESILTGPLGDAGNPSVVYTNDPFGNRDSTTDPIGCTTKTISFDSTNTFPTKVQRCFNDPSPNLIHTTAFTYDPRFGTKTKESGPCICLDPINDPLSPKTTFTFDTFGRLTKVVGPLDTDTFPSETRAYLEWGNPATQRIQALKRKDHLAPTVISREDSFDGLGRFDLIKSTGPNDPITGQARNILDQSFYDSRGLITSKFPSYFDTDALPTFSWDYTYDVMGRQIRVDHPDDRFSRIIYEPGKVTLIDERGKQKIKHLDGYGQVEQIDEINGAETYVTLYDYDTAGMLIHVENNSHHHTRIKYDPIGRKIAMCDPNMGAGPNTTTCDTTTPGSWVYTYDKAGNLKTQADAKLKSLGQALSFDYDSHSRMTKKTYPDTSHIDFTYDQGANAVGRLTHVADLNQMTTDFTYDAMGRVIQTQRTVNGPTFKMSQNYNALSKVVDETFPDLDGTTYTYNEAGWLKSIGSYVDEILYNARGQKKEIDYANGTVSAFNYFDQSADPLKNFALKIRTTTGPSSPQDPSGILQNLSYTYDNVGNVASITDTQHTGGRTFGYDDLNRLTSGSGTFGGTNQSQTSCSYAYDAIGNLLNKCGVAYSYTDPMHPSFVTARDDGKSYTADINGNTQNGDGRTFVWTPDNRVFSVNNASGTTSMDYDYTGTRVKKNGPLGLVLYPFAGYEIGPDGTKTKYFRVGNEIVGAKQTPVVNPENEKKLFYHADHLGGTNVITDINGARVQLNEYDPWGKVSRNDGTVDPEKRFTGQILDPESGLYYYGARYYDPELGRFISPDPIVPSPGDPQSLNRYSYVRNNPVKYIDPTGHSFWSAIGNFFKNLFRRPEIFFATLVVGLVTGGLAWAALPATMGATMAFAIAGAVGGAFAGLTGAGMSGGNLWQGMLIGMVGGAVGGGVYGAGGGVFAGAFAGGFVAGGLGTAFHGGNFFENAFVGGIGSTIMAAAMYGVAKVAGELYDRWKSMPGTPNNTGVDKRILTPEEEALRQDLQLAAVGRPRSEGTWPGSENCTLAPAVCYDPQGVRPPTELKICPNLGQSCAVDPGGMGRASGGYRDLGTGEYIPRAAFIDYWRRQEGWWTVIPELLRGGAKSFEGPQ
jgi:RHS repeat-associated protein